MCELRALGLVRFSGVVIFTVMLLVAVAVAMIWFRFFLFFLFFSIVFSLFLQPLVESVFRFGCRQERSTGQLSLPSSFRELLIYRSNDETARADTAFVEAHRTPDAGKWKSGMGKLRRRGAGDRRPEAG